MLRSAFHSMEEHEASQFASKRSTLRMQNEVGGGLSMPQVCVSLLQLKFVCKVSYLSEGSAESR